ncbi:MAG: 7,8-didemethyl-8-hydroxy-5-deazariboflavin synthase subunit CofG [Candidatus Dadabacteria bacterium RIFCSPHIGHO2_12_FULL_53_21]|nr:MAG: 7,8-didemethyl-8-hydroxy-5-deazariboflavin synthase subunit CofG [Candidatus Dadabacteria bacterium RIFCSPHIGHO2_12_FULL_53_21]
MGREEVPFLLRSASRIRDKGKGKTLTFSRNVFVPLTQICRNRCGYCTFKYEPGEGPLFLTPEEVVEMAKKGAQLGCTELLFVTGDKPELLYPVYREALGKLGYKSTAEYLIAMGEAGLRERIFPHTNLGLATKDELTAFRESNPSMGLMLENISPRLLKKGEAHHGCPDKVPRHRMKTMEWAGELQIPWTSGILVGIGETWEERIDSLYALKELNDAFGHIQEIIIQNFSPKQGITMEKYPPPDFIDMLKIVAISRLIFGEGMNIQIPPNLNPDTYPLFVHAGVNDLGGVSPITIDYVNPEAPWPKLERMRNIIEDLGFTLRERLPVYPEFIGRKYINDDLLRLVRDAVDEQGYVPSEEVHNGTY